MVMQRPDGTARAAGKAAAFAPFLMLHRTIGLRISRNVAATD
jgi:hypothetical protein